MAKQEAYKQFCNKECEFFPCHDNVDSEKFNCLFCYCPLYPLGDKCGGDFTYTKKGVKDCSNCTLPHDPANYEKIMAGCDKVCGEYASARRKKRRALIICAILAVLIGAICILLPVMGIQNMWRAADMLGAPEVAQPLEQLRDAAIAPAYIVAGACALILFAIFFRLRRHKITAFLLSLVVFVGGLVTSLMLTVVNGVPMYTMIGILLEYLSLGAF